MKKIFVVLGILMLLGTVSHSAIMFDNVKGFGLSIPVVKAEKIFDDNDLYLGASIDLGLKNSGVAVNLFYAIHEKEIKIVWGPNISLSYIVTNGGRFVPTISIFLGFE